MTRAELEHLIIEAARVTGESYIYVFGSNAILGQIPEPSNPLLTRSREADLAPGSNDPKKADRIDLQLGELSEFDNEFSYYAQGLTLETPQFAPRGWKDRTVRIPINRDVTGLCMELHDLALSKYGAAREKDLEFTAALVKGGHLQKHTLLERLADVDCNETVRERIRQRIEADYQSREKD
jgi:hypothetical protein